MFHPVNGYGFSWVRRFASLCSGAAKLQVRLPWVRLLPSPGRSYPGYGFFWVRLLAVARPSRTAPRLRLFLGTAICVVVPRSGKITGTASPGPALPSPGRSFPEYGFFWVRLFAVARPCRTAPRLRLFLGTAILNTAFSGCTAIYFVVPGSGFIQVRPFPGTAIQSGERAIA